ncbi:MAG: aminoglycoside phosphotransferase family protein [Caldilineaceae bacterium]|nr:aminoglycoside phosphotransferase family protein [Caldilineaceae bacterium]
MWPPNPPISLLPHAETSQGGYAAPVAALCQIMLDAPCAAHAGLPAGAWTLSRIALSSTDQVQVRYVHPSGQEVVGQWFADEASFVKVVHATRNVAASPSQVVTLPSHRLMWQLGGADRRLPKLAALCQSGATLVVHHPERRAVVRLPDASHYVKVVRPERTAALAVGLQTVHQALAASGARAPQVVSVDADAGLVTMTALPGRALLSGLADDTLSPIQLAELGRRAGETLAALHGSQLPPGAPHDASSEATVLDRWLQRLCWIAPDLHAALTPFAPSVQTALLEGSGAPPVPLHRDCYDKQFIGDATGMGLLDFDTFSWGEAALDVANFLVHCDLRVWQGRCAWAQAATLATAFLQGYGAQTMAHDRLLAYADATRLRLACVYGCRPPQRATVARLVESIGASLIGLMQ